MTFHAPKQDKLASGLMVAVLGLLRVMPVVPLKLVMPFCMNRQSVPLLIMTLSFTLQDALLSTNTSLPELTVLMMAGEPPASAVP